MDEGVSRIQMGLPKGRMQEGVLDLLRQAGIPVRIDPRGYRPSVGWDRAEAKMLKPQNIVEMLGAGSRDVGFAGADWVAELDVPLVDLLDTGLDPVRLVAAAPTALLAGGALPRDRELVVASEYERLARRWIDTAGIRARFVRSYGATEAFPPEDADCIVDNTATGSTLQANGLVVLDELMRSSTHLYASPQAMKDPGRRRVIEDLVLLLQSVLEARRRVLLELNVPADRLEAVVALLPAMREPTVSSLHGGNGYAVKVAVRREELPGLIPRVKAAGGTDLLVTAPSQIVA